VTSPRLPPNYPLRLQLNNEVHARPPEPLAAPSRLSYLALVSDPAKRDAQWAALCDLLERCGAPAPTEANHYSGDLGPFRLKWERHTEFVRYTFIQEAGTETPFSQPVIDVVPADWLDSLPGELMVAAHVAFLPASDDTGLELASGLFPRAALVGADVLDRAASAFTDFRIGLDGYTRFVVQDRSMTPWQAGRVVQSLLEIETYRMMALLALPVAQELAVPVAQWDAEAAQITAAMVSSGDADEPGLLDRLTRLAAAIDSRQANTLYRFSAAAAYDELVQQRIQDMREVRITGLQTLQEFTERRMAPAMATCRSVARRQQDLSLRVARATQLLATRVGVTRERQNQALLEAMNRRTRLQLRLQSTVETLSIAAVTYYAVGLVGHLAEGLHEAGVRVSPPIAMAASIPIVAGLIALILRRVRRAVAVDH
jgi:uncharacterized membrane-anchored protein